MTSNSLALEAARIAELGYAVFPCRGKIPLIPGGVTGATTDPARIEKWWTEWSNANIGLRCENCLVLDLDVDIDKRKDGLADLTRIAEELGHPDANVMVQTGGGGWHMYFARPQGEITGSTGVTWKDQKTSIDIRVGNQYVIAPPSLHESKKHYEWFKPLVAPAELLAIPQPWIEQFLTKKEAPPPSLPPPQPVSNAIISHDEAVARCRMYLSSIPGAVSESGGHTTTLCAANAIFWGFGLDESSGWPIFLDYNRRCHPPWPMKDLRHKMEQVWKRPPPNKDFCWLLNANKQRYDYNDFAYRPSPVSQVAFVPKEEELHAPALSTFKREILTFLWPNRLINGKLNLFCGDGSVGKTWFLCVLCAVVSRGSYWPDGTTTEQGGVYFFTSEDGAGDTLLPRIEDNGGDAEHIYIPEYIKKPDGTPREFSIKDVEILKKNFEQLEGLYGKGYIKLVIFDPITAFMGEIDEFKNNQVRAAFRPMMRLADKMKFTLVGVGHPKKGADMSKAKDAFAGSIAYTNAARLVWNFYHDRDSGVRRMLLAKNNLLVDPKGLSYIVQDGVVSFTDTNISMDADEYLRQFQGQNGHHFGRGRPNEKNKEAQDWLVEYLKDGEKPLGNRENPEHDTIYAEAADRGISKTTLWRAADAIGVRKRKETFSKRWIWSLPEGEPPDETPKIHPEFEAFA